MNFLISSHDENLSSSEKSDYASFDSNENLSSNMEESEDEKDAYINTYSKDNPYFINRKTFYETSQRTNIGKSYNNNPNSKKENAGVFNKKHSYFEDCENNNFNGIANKFKKMADKSFIYTFYKPTKQIKITKMLKKKK